MAFQRLKNSAASADVAVIAWSSPAPDQQTQAGLLGRFIGWIRHRRSLASVADGIPNVPHRIPPIPQVPAPRPRPVPPPGQLWQQSYAGFGGGWRELEQELSNLCRVWRSGQAPGVRQGARQRVMELLIPMAARLACRYHHVATGLTRDDLQQEALLSLCGVLETYSPRHNVPFSAFARRRMHGAILDALRRWGRRHWAATAACRGSDHARPAIAVETVDVVERLLAGLPAPQRRVVELHFMAEMPRSSIAQLLGVHVSRVGQLLREAITALRAEPHPDHLFC